MATEFPQAQPEHEVAAFHAIIKGILQDVAPEYFTHYSYERERLNNFPHLSAAEQIAYEQDVVIRAIHLKYIGMGEIAANVLRLGRFINFREYQKLKNHKTLLTRRSEELDGIQKQKKEYDKNETGIWSGSLLPSEYFNQ